MQTPFPQAFIDRLEQMVGTKKATTVLQALCTPRPISLRANTLRISSQELYRQLTDLGISLEPVPWYEHAFIANVDKKTLTTTDAFKTGSFYIQNLSSMIPPLVLTPEPGESVLDVAAAPGSKTSQMAMMMRNEGKIIANELSRARMFKLQKNLQEQSVTNVTLFNKPGELLWRQFLNVFDKVLVDVPCSMEGRFSCDDPSTYEDWSLKENKFLSTRQKGLLRSGIRCARVGATIVYSTCTLSPEENEEVVDWVLEKERETVELVPISIPHLSVEPGLTHFGKKNYAPQIVNCARIWPSISPLLTEEGVGGGVAPMEGFFVAAFRKMKESEAVR
ncbi:hypothetical protein C5B42_00910 [Candidatus Cerribacteria bacterium 'Amazon FNV 2010 28 9']|uniref:SAM-dependent MTase RsmB/NOP-type domain-containing protein n=1 Tax=Candidatus Cerribacteria bacterium 'Amazon FNV 2010 28 9' TaxID=2081795 RepID=A0A317JQ55_9BACT|nr:MAG: hypothetical protein C5B42_00910 [Candidatus Cerribacteria bacterium 'Amazon FNV 2010 28 9']